MALKKCRECGKEVSTKAKTCPNCGIKEPTSNPTLRGFIALGILIFLAYLFFSSGVDSDPESASHKYEASTPEGKIERSISNFATAKDIIVRSDYALVSYTHTWSGWDQEDVNKKTKRYMVDALQAAIQHTDSERIRVAPFHEVSDGGTTNVAILELQREAFSENKDPESYPGFTWQN